VLLCACSLLPNSAEKKAAEEAAAAAPHIELELSGVTGRLATNVRAYLSVTNKPCSVSLGYLAALGERSREEAREALRAYGYYAPVIKATVAPAGDCPVARVDIDPGPRVLLDKVELEVIGPGATDPAFQKELGEIELKSGDGLDHGAYARAKQLLEAVALERGYLEGFFVKHTLSVNPAALRADVALVFDSGPRYALGAIRIEQQPEFLDEALIRRFLEVEPGKPYDASVVGGYQLALSKSSYFDRVDVRPRLSSPENEAVPVEITLTPRNRHAIETGIGVSTDEGPRGRITYHNRRVNRYGHQFDAGVNGSKIEQKFSAAYRLPRAHPIDEWLTLQAGIRRRDVDAFTNTKSQFSISETKRRPWRWMETHFIELNREDYHVGGTKAVSSFLVPGVSWQRTVTNSDLLPTRGYNVNLELKGAAEALITDTSFARSLLSLAWVRGLPWRSRILTRGQFGALWVDDFSRLPPSERFFAGGDNSIRGYDIESLGPVDATGSVVGGTQLGIASIEFDHYFTEAWGIAAFADTGNAFGGDGRSTGLKTGVGIGLRWLSPVGPVRVDFAHPLDDPDHDFRFHLRIGPDL